MAGIRPFFSIPQKAEQKATKNPRFWPTQNLGFNEKNKTTKGDTIMTSRTITTKKMILMAVSMLVLAITFPQSSYAFGEKWTWAKCPKCNKYYTHTGTDIKATAGRKVQVIATNLKFVGSGKDGSWQSYVVMEDSNKTYTYLVWHLSSVPGFKKGENMSGKIIGRVADLKGLTSNHLHLGFRHAGYSPSMSIKGALPSCSHKPLGLPQFPEKYETPYMKVKVL
jgi:hypothetical protein